MLVVAALLGALAGATLEVGPTRALRTPSAAAAAAADGDELVLDPGRYDDVAIFTRSGLTIRAADPAQRPVIATTGALADDRALWILRGDAITVRGIELTGALNAAQNGAALRLEGAGATLLDLDIHDNEVGIQGLDQPGSDVVLESSQLVRNGSGTGFAHNVSISRVRTLTVRFCLIRDARGGHDLRSRALTSIIAYNWIGATEGSAVSYELEFPLGGSVFVVGNVLQQGASAANSTVLSMATDGPVNPTQALYVVNNSFVNDRGRGTFVVNRSGVRANLVNNLFVGGGTVLDGEADQYATLETMNPGFVDQPGFDYRLAPGSPAIDRGTPPGSVGGRSLAPRFQYVATATFEDRPTVGAIDLGAFERGTVTPTDGGPPPADATPSRDADAEDAVPATDAGTVLADAAPVEDATQSLPDGSADAGVSADGGGLPPSVVDPTRLAVDGGCGCRSSSRAGLGAWALLGLAGFARRRRR